MKGQFVSKQQPTKEIMKENSIKQTFNLLVIAIALSFFSACSTYNNFYSDYDRSVDFTKYRTFAWLPDANEPLAPGDTGIDQRYDNDIIRNNTKNYINHCFSNRSFQVENKAPDLLLELVLLNEKKEHVLSYPSYDYSSYYYNNSYYYPYYYPYYDYFTYNSWDYYPSSSYTQTYKQEYVEGTIILNIYERERKKLVWTGVAEGNIYDPSYIQYDIHPAVHRIIEQFPIKSKVEVRPRSLN